MKTKEAVFLLSATSLLSVSTVALGQQCAHVAGSDWRVNSEATMSLSQGGGGAIIGTSNPDYCQPGWPTSGWFSASTGAFTVTAYNPFGEYDPAFGCAPWVQLSGNVDEPGCDSATGVASNPWEVDPLDMHKSCDVPGGETSQGTGAGGPGHEASAWFTATLNGSGNSYAGRKHKQQTNAAIQAFDTCYPQGSPSAWISLYDEGREFTISQSFTYADRVGRLPDEVRAIQQSGVALPCLNTFGAKYLLSCTTPAWDDYDDVVIAELIYPTYVQISRDGMGYQINFQ